MEMINQNGLHFRVPDWLKQKYRDQEEQLAGWRQYLYFDYDYDYKLAPKNGAPMMEPT